MARTKRREPPKRPQPSSPQPPSPASVQARQLPPARPPRPHKWFLLVTALLLAAWTGFLVVMAML
jgi:hypothetical protein